MTLKFKRASLVIDNDNSAVETNGDQPYIEVFVNDTKQEPATTPLQSCIQCDFNYFFESDLIDKPSTISFSVWDKDRGKDAGLLEGFDKDDRIIAADDTARTVDEYLEGGLFFLKDHQNEYSKLCNYMETVAFWTDQYRDYAIDTAYLRPVTTPNRGSSNRGTSNRRYG